MTQGPGDEREPAGPPPEPLRRAWVTWPPQPVTRPFLAAAATPPPATPPPVPVFRRDPAPAAGVPADPVQAIPAQATPEPAPEPQPEPAPPTPGRGIFVERDLPSWPLTALLVFYPVIWANGFSAFALPLVGALCLGLMIMRGAIRLPRLWLLWTAFVVWSTTSVVMIDTFGRLAGFLQRWSSLAGATLLAVYVYNARTSLPRPTVLRYVTIFFGWVVAGGYLGMRSPYGRISTPILELMPASLANNPYVLDLLSPRFAEVQKPFGVQQAFVRPSAPFVYTNGWGHAYVLLVPLVVAYMLQASRRGRLVAAGLLALSVPPALATLNRGIFIGVAVAAAYVGLRLLPRLTLVGFLRLAALGGAVVAGVLTFGARSLARLNERTSSGQSVDTRRAVYEETIRRTMDSPWLGQGAPRPSETADVSAGTQGHVWYVMFSYGFVGLALFLLTFWGFVLMTWRVRSLQTLLVQTPLVVVNLTIAFYGLDGMHLAIVLLCFALLVRGERRPAAAPARAPAERPAAVPEPVPA